MQYTKLHGVKVQHCFPSDGQAGSNPKVRVVASLDRKRLGTDFCGGTEILIRGVFDEEASGREKNGGSQEVTIAVVRHDGTKLSRWRLRPSRPAVCD
jgi:hypothetical protein